MIKQIHVSECDSTQDLIKEQLKELGGNTNILISCDVQKAGRGRGVNQWSSLPGSLCFSMNIKPHVQPSFTSLELSVLIIKFFEGSKLGLKWPNDVWNAQGKKCCGILIQNHGGNYLAGIGLNLWSDHPDYGGVYDSQFHFDKKSWAKELATFILENRFKETDTLRNEWESKCGHMGSHVKVTEGEETIEGIFTGLGRHGEALISTAGHVQPIYNGSLRVITSDH